MAERGYPMESFEAQARLISVDHPSVVENYRFAHSVRERVESEQASTEDLRGALLRYRSLFDELLQSDEAKLQSDEANRPGDAESLSLDAADRDDRSQRSTQGGAR
jgi:hypothetical protein